MADSFILRYPVPGAVGHEAEWQSVDGSGAPTATRGRGTLGEAAAAAGSRRVIVVVPGEDVMLAAPEMPARGAAKLVKLAPFALEELLATEIEGLHFAVGRQVAGRGVPVAALARERLTQWLATLAAAGLHPGVIASDALLVPANPSHVVVLIDAGRLIVRRPDALPLVLDAEPLESALALAGLSHTADGSASTAHVIVYASAAEWEAHAAAIESLKDAVASVKVQLLAEGPLALLASGAVNSAPLNLLQGEFAVRQGFGGEWPRWRGAALLAGACLALHLLTLGLDYWRGHRDELKVDQELKVVATEALPTIQNLNRLPSVRAAVESRLHATRAAVSEGLMGTLGVLAAASAEAPGTRIDSLSYRDGTTDLTVDAPDVGALDRLRIAAKNRGFNAELQGATQRDSRYQGRLQLKGPA